jgi:hypothetical protein
MQYKSEDIVEYAILLHRSTGTLPKGAFYQALRIKFPGITDRNVRKAFFDAKLLLAIKQVMKDTGE